MDKATKQILCTFFGRGCEHDFALFKKSDTHWLSRILGLGDSGYQGLSKIRSAQTPIKRVKGQSLSEETVALNRALSSQRMVVEHCIRPLKVFRILSERYRNRRRRFGLRVNLISAIVNREVMHRKATPHF